MSEIWYGPSIWDIVPTEDQDHLLIKFIQLNVSNTAYLCHKTKLTYLNQMWLSQAHPS